MKFLKTKFNLINFKSIKMYNPFRDKTLLEKAEIELKNAKDVLYESTNMQEYYVCNIEYNLKRIARLEEFINSGGNKR